jgi:benzoyl-CoA-dihydrodiol lyase
LACDEIVLVDDRSSAVSLPEVPLLGVLPGTGGLTRLTDKRHVRRDLADVFCTTPEGVQGQRAKEWGLVDAVVKPQEFEAYVRGRALALAELTDRPKDARGIELTPLERTVDDRGYHYQYVDVELDAQRRTATLTIRAPESAGPASIAEVLEAGAKWWPLQMSRELDDAILSLRINQLDLGLWVFKTEGESKNVLGVDAVLFSNRDHWLVREVIGMIRRTLARLDVTSRSLYALIEPGSSFAGSLLELALAADRVYMLDDMLDDPQTGIALSEMNFGQLQAANGLTRIQARFYGDEMRISELRKRIGTALGSREAAELGLVTFTPDELDWNDEIRLAIESRLALSPDAMTGLEANLRFGEHESMESRIFGRLSAWQNWIFTRPNAVGTMGALKVYGTGNRAKFDGERV